MLQMYALPYFNALKYTLYFYINLKGNLLSANSVFSILLGSAVGRENVEGKDMAYCSQKKLQRNL